MVLVEQVTLRQFWAELEPVACRHRSLNVAAKVMTFCLLAGWAFLNL